MIKRSGIESSGEKNHQPTTTTTNSNSNNNNNNNNKDKEEEEEQEEEEELYIFAFVTFEGNFSLKMFSYQNRFMATKASHQKGLGTQIWSPQVLKEQMQWKPTRWGPYQL